jgi:uncharacterized tellurite resistance protein B-like protein
MTSPTKALKDEVKRLRTANENNIAGWMNDRSHLVARAEAAEARVAVLETALLSLCNDVDGSWRAFELELREAIGNTNYQVVLDKLNETLAALNTEKDDG